MVEGVKNKVRSSEVQYIYFLVAFTVLSVGKPKCNAYEKSFL